MSNDATAGDPAEKRAAGLAAQAQQKADELAAETTAKAGDLAEVTAAKAMALASALSQTLTAIAERLDLYSAFGKRSRKIIIALAVSFTLDIVLTVVLGLTAFSAHDTAAANSQLVRDVHAAQVALHSSQLSACANGNVFRVNQTTIWHDFVGILTTPTATSTKAQVAQADKLAAQFLTYVGQVNHPVNCVKLYGK